MKFFLGEFYIVSRSNNENFIAKCVSCVEDLLMEKFLFLMFDPKSNNLIGKHFELTNKDEFYHIQNPPQHWRYAEEIWNRYNVL
jgi:hypothetical protein